MKVKNACICAILLAFIVIGCNSSSGGGDADSDDPGDETDPTQCKTPVLSVAGGTYDADLLVSITCATVGASMHYTTDGSEPTASSPAYSSAIPIAGDGSSVTVKAIALKTGMKDSAVASATYVIDYSACMAPTFSVDGGTTPTEGGTFNSDLSVSIACTTGGSTIRYTTDGSTPNASSAVYSSAIAISGHGASVTIKAFSTKADMTDSAVASATFAIDYYTCSTPTFSVDGGTTGSAGGVFNQDRSVTILCNTVGAAIHYTTDGSAPTSASPVYSSAIPVSGDGTSRTIKALATKSGMIDGPVATATFTIDYLPCSTPTFSLDGGTTASAGGGFNKDQNVTILCDTVGAEIHYTTNGSAPTSASPVYSSPIPVSGDGTSRTIKAFAMKTYMTDSAVASAEYTITYPSVIVGYPPQLTFHNAGDGLTQSNEQTPVSGTLTASDILDPTGAGITWSVPTTHDWTGDSLSWTWISGRTSDSAAFSWTGSSGNTSNPLAIGTYAEGDVYWQLTDPDYICSAGTISLSATSGSTISWTYTPSDSTDMLQDSSYALDRIAIVMTTSNGVSVTRYLNLRVNGLNDAPRWSDSSTVILDKGDIYYLIEPSTFGDDVDYGHSWVNGTMRIEVTTLPSDGYLYEYMEDFSDPVQITYEGYTTTDYVMGKFYYKPAFDDGSLTGKTDTFRIKLIDLNDELSTVEKSFQYTYP